MDKVKRTIPEVVSMKTSGKKIKMLTAYDYPTAVLVNRCDVDLILVGDSLGMVVLGYESTIPVTLDEMVHHTKAVVRGAKQTLVIADLPFMSYQISPEQAVASAGRLMKEAGADGVKLEGGRGVIEAVRRIAGAGIPVMGHLGLTPQSASQIGGYKVQGRDAATARAIIEDAKALEQAGVFALVLECVPAPVARIVTESVGVPTIGIGAGPHCDGQVLVTHDLLGLYDRRVAKFVKQYASLSTVIVEALSAWAAEVDSGEFPSAQHSFTMKQEELERLY